MRTSKPIEARTSPFDAPPCHRVQSPATRCSAATPHSADLESSPADSHTHAARDKHVIDHRPTTASRVYKAVDLDAPRQGMTSDYIREFALSLLVEIQAAEQLLELIKVDRNEDGYDGFSETMIKEQEAKVKGMQEQYTLWYQAYVARMEPEKRESKVHLSHLQD